MSIVYLKHYEYWTATISWMAPRKWYKNDGVYVDQKIHNENGIYRIERRYFKRNKENIYIGIAFNQSFKTRITKHYERIEKHACYGDIWISIG